MARRDATRSLARADAETQERCLFSPRSYQRPVLEAMRAGCKRFITVWHRRAGKDRTWLAVTLMQMLQRKGVYVHVFPTLTQARRDIWDAKIDEHEFLDIFPPELVTHRNETELQIELANGSIWQLLGADDPRSIDLLRGMNPAGVVYSEYAVTDPEAWAVLAPAMLENQGWAAFAFTPKGRNHAYTLWQAAQADPAWFTSKRTVEDTRRDAEGEGRAGEPVITEAAIRAEQAVQGWSEEFVQQEFWCSFDASLIGSYYGDQLRAAERDGRMGQDMVWTPAMPCVSAWDLGYDDYAAAWVAQVVGQRVHLLDYLEDSGQFVPYYVKQLRAMEYVFGEHLLPHDAESKGMGQPWSIREQFHTGGARPTRVIPRAANVEHEIQAVRGLFPRLAFNMRNARVRKGVDRLAAYVKQQDAQTKLYRAKPRHDEASHAADALRTLAMGLRSARQEVLPRYAVSATSDIYGERLKAATFAISSTRGWL